MAVNPSLRTVSPGETAELGNHRITKIVVNAYACVPGFQRRPSIETPRRAKGFLRCSFTEIRVPKFDRFRVPQPCLFPHVADMLIVEPENKPSSLYDFTT